MEPTKLPARYTLADLRLGDEEEEEELDEYALWALSVLQTHTT